MSANNARRRQSGRTEVASLGRRRSEKALGLLHLRDRLARASAEYEAHGLEGALEVFQQQLDIEAAIRTHAPETHAVRWAEWLQRDAALAHTADTPHPECDYCRTVELRARDLSRNEQTG